MKLYCRRNHIRILTIGEIIFFLTRIDRKVNVYKIYRIGKIFQATVDASIFRGRMSENTKILLGLEMREINEREDREYARGAIRGMLRYVRDARS